MNANFYAWPNDKTQRRAFLSFEPESRVGRMWLKMMDAGKTLREGGGRVQGGNLLDYSQQTVKMCQEWLADKHNTTANMPQKTIDRFKALLVDTQDKLKLEIHPPLDMARAELDALLAEFDMIRLRVTQGVIAQGGNPGLYVTPEFVKSARQVVVSAKEALKKKQEALPLAQAALSASERAISELDSTAPTFSLMLAGAMLTVDAAKSDLVIAECSLSTARTLLQKSIASLDDMERAQPEQTDLGAVELESIAIGQTGLSLGQHAEIIRLAAPSTPAGITRARQNGRW